VNIYIESIQDNYRELAYMMLNVIMNKYIKLKS